MLFYLLLEITDLFIAVSDTVLFLDVFINIWFLQIVMKNKKWLRALSLISLIKLKSIGLLVHISYRIFKILERISTHFIKFLKKTKLAHLNWHQRESNLKF
jgi:hypothetical protein